MKKSNLPWSVKQLTKMYEKGTLNFDYPIQRAGKQWDELQKSLLIHSIASGYPVPPLLFLKTEEGGDITFVLDGKQRVTNIIDFVLGTDGSKLHESTPSLIIEGEEEEVEIAGKTFEELSEDVKTEILTCNMSIYRLEEATDDEIEELFFRWNNGTPLTKQQKARAKMGLGNAKIIGALLKHSFLQDKAVFTPLQRKRSDDEAVILQAMMLMSDYDFESFVADKILKFAQAMKNDDITAVAEDIEIALDYLNDAFEESNPLFKKLHLPTLLIVAKKASDDKISKELFEAWVEDFSNAINPRAKDKTIVSTKYKTYTGAGSVKKDKVLGREASMMSHFETFVEKMDTPVEKLEKVEEVNELEKVEETDKEEVLS